MERQEHLSAAAISAHVPVLANEVIEWIAPRPGQVIIDGTLGGGGHTKLLAERVAPNGYVLAVDRDPAAVARVEQTLLGCAVKLATASFRDVPVLVRELKIAAVDAILLDLGLSSDQLADANRGFSYEVGGPLDMRFDPASGEPAWRLLERLTADQIADILYRFGEERCSRRIARRIVETRRRQPIRLASELAQLVRSCVPRAKHHRIDPATRTFQALRIAVNDELGAVEQALRELPDLLRAGGRLAVISFHSLEDRLVKQAFRDDPRWLVLTKKPIRPNESEVARNPRSRSARLRVAERSGAT